MNVDYFPIAMFRPLQTRPTSIMRIKKEKKKKKRKIEVSFIFDPVSY